MMRPRSTQGLRPHVLTPICGKRETIHSGNNVPPTTPDNQSQCVSIPAGQAAQSTNKPAQYKAAIGAGMPSKSNPAAGDSEWPSADSPAYRANRHAAAGSTNRGTPCNSGIQTPPSMPEAHSDIKDNPTNAGARPPEIKSAMESNHAP